MIQTVLALALAATGPRLEGSVAAGAGYDSNLNHAAAGNAASGVRPVDAAFAFAGAGAGVSLDLGGSTSLFGGLRLDAERYADVADLGTTSGGVEAALVQELGSRVALVVAPSATKTWTGDPARDAAGLAARLTLRVKPLRDVALRAFAGWAERDAADPVFSSRSVRLGGSLEWSPAARTFLSAGYSETRGEEVFYRPVAGGASGPGMGRRVDTFGSSEEAYRADALSRSVSAALEVGLGGKVHLFGSWAFRRVTSDEPTFEAHVVTAGLGARM